MCADPAGLPSLLHLLYNMARLRGQHSCPQMMQMNTDKSRSCIDREFSTLHSSAKLNHHAGSFFLTCFFICVHLRHLRTDSPIPSFAIKHIPPATELGDRAHRQGYAVSRDRGQGVHGSASTRTARRARIARINSDTLSYGSVISRKAQRPNPP